jgi:hypothetical protein
VAKTKTKKKAPKNLGGRPRKDPSEKTRRIVVYVPGSHFRAILRRAHELEMKPKRGPNEGRPRTQSETEDAIVAAYSRERLIELANRLIES